MPETADTYDQARRNPALQRLADEVATELYRCEQFRADRTATRDALDELTDGAIATRDAQADGSRC